MTSTGSTISNDKCMAGRVWNCCACAFFIQIEVPPSQNVRKTQKLRLGNNRFGREEHKDRKDTVRRRQNCCTDHFRGSSCVQFLL